MLQNTAILKILGSLAVVGGTIGMGYCAHSKGLFSPQHAMLEDESVTKYLIVKSVALENDEAQEGEIYIKKFLTETQKNFKCVLSNDSSKNDEKCEIYKLSNKEKELAKAITNNLSANSTNIKAKDNYFKIKISNDVIDAITKWDDINETISITHTTATTENKKFAKLIPIYLVDNNKIIKRKTSVLFGKTTAANNNAPSDDATNTETKNYKCKIDDQAPEFDCHLTDIAFHDTKKTITLPAAAFDTLTTANLKAADKYFAIEMEQEYLDKLTINNDEDKKIHVVSTKTDESNKKYAEIKPIFKILDKEVTGKNNFWTLTKGSTLTTGDAHTSAWPTDDYTECQIEDKETKFKCEIYKINSSETKENLNFSSNLTKITQNSDVTVNTPFIVKFTENPENIEGLKTNAKVTLISKEQDKKNYVFTANSRLFNESSTTGDNITVTGAFILDL